MATVNNVIEAYDDPAYGAIMEAADLVTPDGMPLVWGLRSSAFPQRRVCTAPISPQPSVSWPPRRASRRLPWGGAQDVLEELTAKLPRRFPGLKVAYRASAVVAAVSVPEPPVVILFATQLLNERRRKRPARRATAT